jgi:hypothetical protein
MLPSSSPPPSESKTDRLSTRGAIFVGIFSIFCGAIPVLAGLGFLSARPEPGVQPWVVVAAGTMFILAGLAVINGYVVAGGPQANGDLAADAPMLAKVVQYLLGVGIVGLMFAVFAWVAFGPGERHFSSSMSMPGRSTHAHSSERSGRIIFGIAASSIGLFFAFSTVLGAKRLWSSRRRASRVE